MFIDASAIVAGAVVEDRTFTDQTLFEGWMTAWEVDAESTGNRVEIQALFHDHVLNEEVVCDCSQYVTDHSPYRVFNVNGNT